MSRVTNIYVDGFNLYFGALKNTPYKWLNLYSLAQQLLPAHQNEIQRIKYFTARVRQHHRLDQAPDRQDAYLRALRTLPCVTVIEGHFLRHAVELPRVEGGAEGKPEMVRVWRTDEKRSDVALATHLISDAYDGDCEVSVIVTNDSDQVPAVRLLTETLKVPVGIIFPTLDSSPSAELKQVASFTKVIRPTDLEKSLFPHSMRDGIGRLECPDRWRG